MRLTTLLAFSCLLACTSQPQTAAPSAPAVAPESEQDEWNGFGSNEHAEEEPLEKGAESGAPREGNRVRRFCEKLTALVTADTEPGHLEAVRFSAVEQCIEQSEEQIALDPEDFEASVSCVLPAETAAEMFECLNLGDAKTQERAVDSGDRVVQVCTKMAELAQQETDLPEEAKLALVDIDTCVVEGRKEQGESPEEFERLSNCVLNASTMHDVVTCAMQTKEL